MRLYTDLTARNILARLLNFHRIGEIRASYISRWRFLAPPEPSAIKDHSLRFPG